MISAQVPEMSVTTERVLRQTLVKGCMIVDQMITDPPLTIINYHRPGKTGKTIIMNRGEFE